MRRVALLFPGQGAQYAGMAADLYHSFPTARKVIGICFVSCIVKLLIYTATLVPSFPLGCLLQTLLRNWWRITWICVT